MVRVTLTIRTPPSLTSTRGRQNTAQHPPATSASHGATLATSLHDPSTIVTISATAHTAPTTAQSTRPNNGR